MRMLNRSNIRLAILGAGLVFGSMLGGCATERTLPQAMMPTPPKECEQVLGFKVDPLPGGKSNAAALSVAMAKEGAARQQEHATAKVCAEYALRTAGTMKDKEAPAAAKKGVNGTAAAPAAKATKSETPAS